MKLICEKENLLLGLNSVSRSSIGRTTNPGCPIVAHTSLTRKATSTTSIAAIGKSIWRSKCSVRTSD